MLSNLNWLNIFSSLWIFVICVVLFYGEFGKKETLSDWKRWPNRLTKRLSLMMRRRLASKFLEVRVESGAENVFVLTNFIFGFLNWCDEECDDSWEEFSVVGESGEWWWLWFWRECDGFPLLLMSWDLNLCEFLNFWMNLWVWVVWFLKVEDEDRGWWWKIVEQIIEIKI